MTAAKEHRIEVVRGRLTEERKKQILRFWKGQDALTEEDALERLPQVVCVLLSGPDDVVGVNSAFARHVQHLGGRSFWIYRSLIAADFLEQYDLPMIEAARDALAAEFDPGGEGPIGICLFADEASMGRHPEAVWPGSGLLHAGYLADGRGVRVAYFEGSRI